MPPAASTLEPEPPRTRRAAAMAPADRRSMLVEATLPLLCEHGEKVTTRQIAEAAGIAEGTIFRVFPDKDALIVAVLDAVLDPAPFDDAVRALPADLPFADAVLAVVELAQARALEIYRLAAAVGPRFSEHARRSLSRSAALDEFFGRHRSELRIAPAEAARLLRAITIAVTHPSLAAEAMAPGDVVELFLHGVAGRGR